MEFKGKKKISVLELTGLFIGDSKLHIFALAYQMEKALLATHQKYIGREALEVVVWHDDRSVITVVSLGGHAAESN